MPILIIIALMLLVLVQIQVFEIAFIKLGLTPQTTLTILVATLLGSAINIPLFTLKTTVTGHWVQRPFRSPLWEILRPTREGRVIIAVNVGGCLIPVALSIYFWSLHSVSLLHIGIGLLTVSALSYKLSQPVPGVGIGMPVLIAPATSSLIALLLDPQHAAHIAYISGVLGVLLGADILNIEKVRELGTPIASIGGAGTFDGIFLTGILAALIA